MKGVGKVANPKSTAKARLARGGRRLLLKGGSHWKWYPTSMDGSAR